MNKKNVASGKSPFVWETYIKLFDFFPLLKIEEGNGYKTFFLFYVLPVFRRKEKEARNA